MSARRGIVSTLILAAIVAAFTAAGPGAVALGKREPAKTTVKYGDLNLHTEKGVKKLLRRIKRAAYKVCGGYGGAPSAYEPRSLAAYRSCVNGAQTNALNTLAANFNQRAETALAKGDLAGADDLHRRGLTLNRVLERKEAMAQHLGGLSVIATKRGDLTTAADCHRQALALNQELGRKDEVAAHLDRLGWIERQRGDLQSAEDYYRRALAVNAELGRTEGLANHLRNLGLVAWSRGDVDKAEALHRSALALHEGLDNAEEMAASHSNLGLIARSRGDLEAARDHHRRALALNAELGRKEHMAIQHGHLWALALEQSRLEEAEIHLRQALRLDKERGVTGETPALGETQMGLIRLAKGQKSKACASLGRAQQFYRQAGNDAEVGKLGQMMQDSLCQATPAGALTASLQ